MRNRSVLEPTNQFGHFACCAFRPPSFAVWLRLAHVLMCLLFGVTALLLFSPVNVLAGQVEVYRWTDESGQVHFSDQKPADTEAKKVVVESKQRFTEDINAQLDRTAKSEFYAERRADRRRLEKESRERAERLEWQSKESDCMRSRRRYYVVTEQMPIYVDETGEYRVGWANDPYTGARKWVPDRDRDAVAESVWKEIEQFCREPDDPEEQEEASWRQDVDETCDIETAFLKELSQESAKNTEERIERQRLLAESVCALKP